MNDGAGGTFIGKVEEKEEGKQITLYPIPFEFEEQQIISLCEEQLQVEKPQKITYGHHRNHPQLRNGFLHLRLKENEIACLPEVILINNRPVTVLKPGQRLYRPCKFCRSRTHEYGMCPHYQRQQELEEKKESQERKEAGRIDSNNEVEKEETKSQYNVNMEVLKEPSIFSPTKEEECNIMNPRKRVGSIAEDEMQGNRAKAIKEGATTANLEALFAEKKKYEMADSVEKPETTRDTSVDLEELSDVLNHPIGNQTWAGHEHYTSDVSDEDSIENNRSDDGKSSLDLNPKYRDEAYSDEETEKDPAEQNKQKHNDDKEKQIGKVKQQVNAIEKDVSPKTQRSPKYIKSGKNTNFHKKLNGDE
jgi:hypothetical protein